MHSCVRSKNVKWCHLIWPTLYISCAKLQLDLFIADNKYDSTRSPITRPYQIPWLFQQGWMAKIHQYTIQCYCRHLQVLGQLFSIFLWI